MMLVFSMMAAAAYYLVQAIRFGGSFRLAFIFVTLTTPLLLMIGVGVGYRLLAWHERRTRRRQRSAAD